MCRLNRMFEILKSTESGCTFYLRLVGQEGDVDLRQGLDDFGRPTLHQLVEEWIRAGCAE